MCMERHIYPLIVKMRLRKGQDVKSYIIGKSPQDCIKTWHKHVLINDFDIIEK